MLEKAQLLRLGISLFGAAIVAACATNAGSTYSPNVANTSARVPWGSYELSPNVRRLCNDTRFGYANCLALLRTDIAPHILPTPSAGYGPKDLQAAYHLPSSTRGSGQTIAIVDAYGYPSAEVDMAKYRSYYHLRPCSTSNGCFVKLNQNGSKGPYPPYSASWSAEQSLDLDVVSAICPRCQIVLVEANTNAFNDLASSEDTAAKTGAAIISNSFGAPDQPYLDSEFASSFDHAGIVATVGAGDTGYGVYFPADLNTVVAVGGTTLKRSKTERGWSETVWSGTGSGCSLQSKPSWQRDKECPFRTVADVAADADPNTGVVVFCKCLGGWRVIGGTSASTPLIAGVYGLAQNASLLKAAQSVYADPSKNLYDVISGSNGQCVPKYLCTGEKGYDGPTGLGAPNDVYAF